MEMVGELFGQMRTWYLLVSFSLLVCLKQGTKFVTIYAKDKLDACDQDGDMLLFAYAISSTVSGVLGGKIYDMIPSKMGIGAVMTAFNVINVCSFVFILSLEATGNVTWMGLYTFMIVTGFSSVLPVSLPFQVYAISIGGVKHTGLIVSIFELSAQGTGALLELGLGVLLKQKSYTSWLLLNVFVALPGTILMALFYYEDWRKAPLATNFVSAPKLDTHDKKSIGRAMMFAAAQAETKDDVEKAQEGRVVDLLTKPHHEQHEEEAAPDQEVDSEAEHELSESDTEPLTEPTQPKDGAA